MTTPLDLSSRLASAAVGGFFGIPYGFILMFAVSWAGTGSMNMLVVVVTAVTFAALGFLVGPFIGDVVGALLHLIFGLLDAFSGPGSYRPGPNEPNYAKGLFALGLGTGIVITWSYLS